MEKICLGIVSIIFTLCPRAPYLSLLDNHQEALYCARHHDKKYRGSPS